MCGERIWSKQFIPRGAKKNSDCNGLVWIADKNKGKSLVRRLLEQSGVKPIATRMESLEMRKR
jgi:hypothetical protein